MQPAAPPPHDPTLRLATGASLDEVDSTNDELLRRWEDGRCVPGDWLSARRQTAGRGRRGRSWVSHPEHSVPLSILLPAASELRPVAAYTMLGAVAVDQLLEDAGVGERRIKWPNDVLWRERKLAGVLAENRTVPSRGAVIVLGIGLNATQVESDFPPELRPSAASLTMAGAGWNRDEALTKLVAALDRWLRLWERDGPAALARRFSESLGLIGRLVELRGPGGPGRGRLLGVEPDGTLLLQSGGGQRRWAGGHVEDLGAAED